MAWEIFQPSLFLGITTLVTWHKSTLLLKNKCFDTHIYMKTQCLQTNKMQHYCGKENAWEAGWVRKKVALIKSLIYARRKRRAWVAFVKDWPKVDLNCQLIHLRALDLCTCQNSHKKMWSTLFEVIPSRQFEAKICSLSFDLQIVLRVRAKVVKCNMMTFKNRFLSPSHHSKFVLHNPFNFNSLIPSLSLSKALHSKDFLLNPYPNN